jgi:hypothetical protein
LTAMRVHVYLEGRGALEQAVDFREASHVDSFMDAPLRSRGDGGPRKGETSRREERQRPLDGGTGCDCVIDKRLLEEGFSANLPPPIFGKTEVTRELD